MLEAQLEAQLEAKLEAQFPETKLGSFFGLSLGNVGQWGGGGAHKVKCEGKKYIIGESN